MNSRQNAKPRVRIADIKAAVAFRWGLTAGDFTSPRRFRRIAHPRQVAMYLCRELTESSYPLIGRVFGGRDHTTVLHARRAVMARMAVDQELARAVEAITELAIKASFAAHQCARTLRADELVQRVAAQ